MLKVSRRVGVGESSRALAHHSRGMLRLAQPGEWRPDAIVDGIAPYLGLPHYRIDDLHMYTFNDLAATERWRRSLLERVRTGEGTAS
jgi:methylenetetrahydrofolate reductase (NADPH)